MVKLAELHREVSLSLQDNTPSQHINTFYHITSYQHTVMILVDGSAVCHHTLFTYSVNPPSQPTPPTHPINAPHQRTPSTHPINAPHQHTLSTHPINTPYQHTPSTHPINTPYQPTPSTPSLRWACTRRPSVCSKEHWTFETLSSTRNNRKK